MNNATNSVLTMILAGGQGERLYPLTKERAKPAVRFGGIYRIIDFTLSNCINSDLRRIYVLTQYNSVSLDRHLRLGWSVLNSELGEYIHSIPPQQRTATRWYRGTADAIYQNVDTLQRERPDRVLILSGDHVYKMDYRPMLDFHCDAGADLTVACVEVPREQASQFGIMSIDSQSRITGFAEKPTAPTSMPGHSGQCLASTGIYVFNTEVLVRRVAEDARRDTAHDFGRDIIPAVLDRGRVFAFNLRDGNRNQASVYWRDIGLLDTYWQANMDLLATAPEFDLYDRGWPVRTYQSPQPPARVLLTGGANAIIASGCTVGDAQLERSILANGARVEAGASVSDSLLMEGVVVGAEARVHRAIVDRDVAIPPGYRIGSDPEEDRRHFTVTPRGVTVVPQGLPLEG